MAFTHDLLVCDDEESHFSVTEPFAREGISRGEMTLIDVTTPARERYQEMFADEPLVQVSRTGTYAGPAAAVTRYENALRLYAGAGATGLRVIGAIDFDSFRGDWREWLHYESAINQVLNPYEVHGLCVYDERHVSAEVIEAVDKAHPTHRDQAGRSNNTDYLEPMEVMTRLIWRVPEDPLQASPPTLELADVDDPASVRLDLQLATLNTLVPRSHVADFVSAVHEIVVNALRHGAPPVRVRLWSGRDHLVCTVTDQGPGIGDPVQGFGRPRRNGGSPGMGVWAARQLCDVLDYRHTDEGFAVRLIARS